MIIDVPMNPARTSLSRIKFKLSKVAFNFQLYSLYLNFILDNDAGCIETWHRNVAVVIVIFFSAITDQILFLVTECYCTK